MFAAPAPPTYTPPPPPAAAPLPPQTKGPNKTVLIAVFGGLFLVLIVAILIFALKK